MLRYVLGRYWKYLECLGITFNVTHPSVPPLPPPPPCRSEHLIFLSASAPKPKLLSFRLFHITNLFLLSHSYYKPTYSFHFPPSDLPVISSYRHRIFLIINSPLVSSRVQIQSIHHSTYSTSHLPWKQNPRPNQSAPGLFMYRAVFHSSKTKTKQKLDIYPAQRHPCSNTRSSYG